MPSKDDLNFAFDCGMRTVLVDYEWEYLIKTHFEIPWPLWRIGNWKRERTKGGGNESVIKDRQVGSCSEPILAICLVWLPPHGKWPAQRALNAGVIKSLLLLSSVPLNPLLLVVTGTANCNWNKNGKFLLWSSLHLILISWAMDIG